MAIRISRRPPDGPISMYVPARNSAAHLGECIQAIRNQTRPPDELFILLDPRSTDRTAEVAASTGVRVIVQQGQTLGAARNEAIQAAAYRWLASCDSDVILEPNWLERLAERRGDGAVGIAGRTNERVRNPCDQWRAMHMPHHWGAFPLRNPFMLVSEVLFDRQALLSVGGYRQDLNYSEDSDLCQRLREAGYDLLYEPAAVATHQRSDDLIGLLTLRWKYSEFRQRHLMDRYSGLVAKCDVNREYALNTLSRSLARRQEELTYISFFLFFHHLVLDLRSLLSRRPLLGEATKGQYERHLVGVVVPIVADYHWDLAQSVEADLSRLCTASSQAEARPLPANQGWNDYLERIRTACASFGLEFGSGLLDVIAAAARYMRGEISSEQVLRLNAPTPEALRAVLEEVPIQPFIDEAFYRSIQDHWPDARGVRVVGPLAESERAWLNGQRWANAGGARVVLAAHLEARPDPLGVYAEVEESCGRLVVCYQPTGRFIAGLDVPSASDLAEAAAAAGWTIERFETLVGRTRLMLSRPVAEPPSSVCTSGAVACHT